MCVVGEFSHLELLLCVATFRKMDYNLHKMKKISYEDETNVFTFY